MNMVLLGPPGAGKGTQAQRLAKAFDLRHLSSGDMLRAERRAGTALGKRVESYMDSGALVPDDIIIEVVLSQLPSESEAAGCMLDGFPRTETQAESLDKALADAGRKLDLVLELTVPDDVIVERITGRRICPKCDGVYHIRHTPPKKAGVCDREGAELVHRPDDTEAVVRQRLAAYHGQTKPLEVYYRRKGLLVEADGMQSPDAVFACCRKIVGDRMHRRGD